MSAAEKYFLSDIENLIEMFGKKTSFNILEERYKKTIKEYERDILGSYQLSDFMEYRSGKEAPNFTLIY